MSKEPSYYPKRSLGYRPRKAERAEVMELRAQLAECHAYEWQKATRILNQRDARGQVDGARRAGRTESMRPEFTLVIPFMFVRPERS